MREFGSMSIVMRERERPPKVWQPWYMDEAEGGGKELPSRTQREQRARERLTIPKHPQLTVHQSPSPGCSSEEDEINVVDSPPPTHAHYAHYYTLPMDIEVEEGPIDMSTKRRSPTHTDTPTIRTQTHIPNSPSPPPYHPRPNYLPRPSVITCVPPKYAHAPTYPHREPPPYSVATALLSQQRAGNLAQKAPKELAASSRQVMQAGPVDPEIDEHFRRSLGQDYHHLFSASAAQTDPSTDSVDDHFAKALGETWTKLQAERKDTSTTTITSSTTTASNTTTTTTTPSSTLNEGDGGGGGGDEGGAGRRSPVNTISTSSISSTTSSSSTSSSTASSTINTPSRLTIST